MIRFGDLIDGVQTKSLLEREFAANSSPQILSAFFSMPAFHWICDSNPEISPELVIRGRVADFSAGASSIDAVIAALGRGWRVRYLYPLHAKVYAFESALVVGSGNLTANGLSLIDDRGNIELNTYLRRTKDSDHLIEAVLASADELDLGIAQRMREHLETLDREIYSLGAASWPATIYQPIRRRLFCADFPIVAFHPDTAPDNEPWSSIHAAVLSGDVIASSEELRRSATFVWLRGAVADVGGEARFGLLSHLLHDVLLDDTRIYRSTVKLLLANLLSFASVVRNAGISVERPQHSQIIRVID